MSREYKDFYWLNEDSQKFLQGGYLLENVTVEERVRQIANHAESILGIEGYADELYDVIAKGWMSLSTPIWCNFGAGRSLPISCVVGDTWINTDKGGKQAKDIQIGDMVLTHKNRYRPVTAIMPTPKKDDIWRLKVGTRMTNLYITGNHLVLTNLGWVRVDELNQESHFIAVNSSQIDQVDEEYIVEVKDGLTYCRIQTLERTDKVEDVYDFTVEEDHSFSCAGVVVHNCFNSHMSDSIDSIFSTIHEVAMMSKEGGGTSIYMGDIRPRGSKITNNGTSNGSFSFLEPIQSTLNSVSQGKSRRGMVATYIDIEHGDIEEWLNIRKEGSPIQDIYWGVCVGNDWLDEMRKGDRYKREIWAKVLQTRSETGVPYIFFKDNANNNKPDVYRDRNLKINASNLCVEIMLPSTKDESFVCCLSSLNLLHFDKWKNSRLVKIATYFLDAVMSEFIHLAKHIPGFDRAVRFAERHRALGLGVLGWHSYLQSNMIPFESYEAMQKNAEVFRTIRAQADEASHELAERYGEPELLKGYGRRNTTLLAIAPTKSSSFILGQVSPSIEPFNSNFFIKDLAKIKTVFKNPFLEELLEKKGFNTEEIWSSILLKEGSVQHLDILTQEEKDVFKTFSELSQITVIQQAAQRQAFVDQGQSVNLMVHPATPPQDINGLYMLAADLGLKGLYYQFSSNAAQVFNRSLVTECLSCSA